VRALLIALELLGASVWIGGLVAIAVVARIVRAQLPAPARVEFFRALGRRYLLVGGAALALALACGGALLASGAWTATKSAVVALAGALVFVTALAVLQARALTRARRRLLATAPGVDPEAAFRREARLAAVLRLLLAALSAGLLALAAVLAS